MITMTSFCPQVHLVAWCVSFGEIPVISMHEESIVALKVGLLSLLSSWIWFANRKSSKCSPVLSSFLSQHIGEWALAGFKYQIGSFHDHYDLTFVHRSNRWLDVLVLEKFQ